MAPPKVGVPNRKMLYGTRLRWHLRVPNRIIPKQVLVNKGCDLRGGVNQQMMDQTDLSTSCFSPFDLLKAAEI
jgi:hypothetical protein